MLTTTKMRLPRYCEDYTTVLLLPVLEELGSSLKLLFRGLFSSQLQPYLAVAF
jgi:hypothetical protein